MSEEWVVCRLFIQKIKWLIEDEKNNFDEPRIFIFLLIYLFQIKCKLFLNVHRLLIEKCFKKTQHDQIELVEDKLIMLLTSKELKLRHGT